MLGGQKQRGRFELRQTSRDRLVGANEYPIGARVADRIRRSEPASERFHPMLRLRTRIVAKPARQGRIDAGRRTAARQGPRAGQGRRSALGAASVNRAQRGECRHTRRTADGERHGDSRTHGMADNYGPRDVQSVQQTLELGQIDFQRRRLRWQVAAPVAERVVGDDAAARRERIDLRLPDFSAKTDPVNEHHRRPGAARSIGGSVARCVHCLH